MEQKNYSNSQSGVAIFFFDRLWKTGWHKITGRAIPATTVYASAKEDDPIDVIAEAKVAISRPSAGSEEVGDVIHHWREALNHFTILWPERMPARDRVAS